MDVAKMVNEREKAFQTLHTRMDRDLGLHRLEAYVMEDYDGKKVKAVDNVTLNDARTFGDRVISILSSAMPRIDVRGKQLSDDEAKKIEGWWQGLIYAADERLSNMMMPPVHNCVSTYAALRGWVALRCVLWQDGDRIVGDILPLDPHYVVWEVGPQGLLWAAYKQKRTKAQVAAEYRVDLPEGKKEPTVIDWWNDTQHVVNINNQDVRVEAHNLGQPPFVIVPVGLTPQMQSGDGSTGDMQYFGESIYAANADLYREFNKIATILQTRNSLSFRVPLGYESEDGTKVPEQYPYAAARIIAMAKGEKWQEVPMRELREAGLFFNLLSQQIQRGSFPYTEWGNLDFPLSAIAIEKLEGHRDQVFIPRLQAITLAYRKLMRLAKEQMVRGGFQMELGEEGDELEYTAADLDKRFTVHFRMSTVSPEKNIANYSIAQAAQQAGISRDTVAREILQIENPTEEHHKHMAEEAGDMVMAVRLYRYMKSLLEEAERLTGDERDAKLAEVTILKAQLAQLGMTVDEKGGLQVAETAPTQPPEGAAGIPAQARVGLPQAEAGTQMPLTAEQKIQRQSLQREGIQEGQQ